MGVNNPLHINKKVTSIILLFIFLCSSFTVALQKNSEVVKCDTFSTSNTGGNGLMDSPWPMKCYDQYHTSQSPYSTANNNGA